ncbi:MAG: NUDIX domain-containing protein [Propionibacteriaceae bacterium]|nr:NUDIX domain-containing protein [Propionibacteriaceae bacterium]
MPSIRNLAVGLPLKDGCILVSQGVDRVRGLHFVRALGGGIEFGETAEAALHREFHEELGCRIDSAQLLGVLENIFEYEGMPGHEIVHVFSVDSAELAALPIDVELRVLDEGSPVRWVPVNELLQGQPPLFPDGALRLVPRETR